ncbi:MAG: biotin transporter BioY [Anaeroplasmataceae bacterium]
MKSIYNISLIAIMLSLMIIGSKITIPLPTIPMTLQTFMVFLIPLVLGRIRGVIIMALYTFLGLVGLPVFSSGGGIGYILTPSFGYILSFILAQLLITYNKDKRILSIISIALALILIYFIGTIYMYFILNFHLGKNVSILYSISIGVLPFVIKDCISVVLAVLVGIRVRKALSFKYSVIKNDITE